MVSGPFSLEPMLCPGAERLPEGREWRYELKLDGFCAIGRKAGRSAQLWSRNQKNFARRFPGMVNAVANWPDDTLIEGEVAALDEQGRSSFDILQGSCACDSALPGSFPEPPRRLEGSEKTLAKAHPSVLTMPLPKIIRLP